MANPTWDDLLPMWLRDHAARCAMLARRARSAMGPMDPATNKYARAMQGLAEAHEAAADVYRSRLAALERKEGDHDGADAGSKTPP